MLQKPASNASSLKMVANIKTKPSKWLEQNLQDMEEKVQYVLSLIEEDGDSFAKRAEKYYKSRPELTSFIEDSYQAFTALAERYDHVSAELQNANHTLATCFPEQYQLPTDEDDEYGTNKPPRIPPDSLASSNDSSVPKDPKALAEDLKGIVQQRSKELESKNTSEDDDSGTRAVAKSGMSKTEAIAEIDRLHKDIVGLQTVKEYIKSGLEKCSCIENTILEKQQKVCDLQDEFDIYIDKQVMEDDDKARRLIAEATLGSCHENLSESQETHQQPVEEAKEEKENIEDAIKDQHLDKQTDGQEKTIYKNNDSIRKTKEVTQNLCVDLDEAIQGKIKEHFDISSLSSMPVKELAEKIDKLVNEVINLQSSVSSQTALIDRLRSESNELREHIRTLENDKATLTEETHDLRRKVKELQEKLDGFQHLSTNVERLNTNLETRFNETQSSRGNISDRLSQVKNTFHSKISTQEKRRPREESKTQEEKKTSDMSKTVKEVAKYSNRREQNDDLQWPAMLLNGVEDKEELLLKEYTTILKYYKDLRRKLDVVENKERNDHSEQITELRVAIAKRDEEIQHLRHKLITLQRKFADTTNSNADELSASSLSDDQRIEDMSLEGDNKLNFILSDHNTTISPVEEKLRRDIDTILDQNLDFWLRLSMSFNQIQKFKALVKDLQRQISETKNRTKQQENKVTFSIKSEIRPIYKHMKKIKTELTTWLKQSVQLKDEVEHRFSSLCNVQDKISLALKEGAGEEIRFSSHQAAKFQGEILNMKQENKKVSDLLQAGVDHITSIQVEVDRTLKKLDDEFGQSSGNQNDALQAPTRATNQFRKLILGSKGRKQRNNFMLSAFAS